MQNEVLLYLSTQLLHILSTDHSCLRQPSFLASLVPTEQEQDRLERKLIVQVLQVALKSLSHHVLSEPFCYALLATILRSAILSDIPVVILQRGLQRSLRSALGIMEDVHSPLRIRIDWSNKRMISSIMYSFVERIDHLLDDVDHAIDIILKTFLSTSRSAVQNTKSIGNSPPELRLQYHTIAGPATTSTKLYTNTLLMDIPVSLDLQSDLASSCSRRPAGFIVALFSCSLEIPTPATSQVLQLSLEEHGGAQEEVSAEYLLLQAFAQQVQRSHVDIVICQKRVHPYLQRQLRARGILVLPRVSVRYMAALQGLTGARVHASQPSLTSTTQRGLDPSSLGYLRGISFTHKFGKAFVVAEGYPENENDGDAGDKLPGEKLQDHLLTVFSTLEPAFLLPYVKGAVPQHRTFSSVLLTAPSEIVLEKWKMAFEACIAHLSGLIPGPSYALPGAGMWQTYVAQQLRLQAQATPTRASTRVERQSGEVQSLFAQCLERSAQLVCGQDSDGSPSFGHDRIALHMKSLQSAVEIPCTNAQPVAQLGAHIFKNISGESLEVLAMERAPDGASPVREYFLPPAGNMVPLDGLQGSLLALRVAVDTACALLSVDGVVVLEPETVER